MKWRQIVAVLERSRVETEREPMNNLSSPLTKKKCLYEWVIGARTVRRILDLLTKVTLIMVKSESRHPRGRNVTISITDDNSNIWWWSDEVYSFPPSQPIPIIKDRKLWRPKSLLFIFHGKWGGVGGLTRFKYDHTFSHPIAHCVRQFIQFPTCISQISTSQIILHLYLFKKKLLYFMSLICINEYHHYRLVDIEKHWSNSMTKWWVLNEKRIRYFGAKFSIFLIK